MRSPGLLFVFGAFALSFSAPSFAKKNKDADAASAESTSTEDAAKTEKELPAIEATGIAEFDPTFMKAKAIHDTLDTVKTKLADSNKNLATALALPETASLDEALAELKTKAAGKIKVGMKGTMPSLSVSDAVPEDVQKAIDAVNTMISDLGASLTEMKTLPGEATAVVVAVKDFPSQLNPDLLTKNSLKASDLPKVAKKLKNDMKAVASTPQRVVDVTGEITGLFSKVQATFAN